MKRKNALTLEFVEYIPDDLKNGTLYVSISFATVVHKCCCGCGNEVVTPLSPSDWKLTFDGQTISLDPSIGNWNFPCQSHYLIKHNLVKWVPQWSQKEIDAGRRYDSLLKERYYGTTITPDSNDNASTVHTSGADKSNKGFWQKLKKWLF